MKRTITLVVMLAAMFSVGCESRDARIQREAEEQVAVKDKVSELQGERETFREDEEMMAMSTDPNLLLGPHGYIVDGGQARVYWDLCQPPHGYRDLHKESCAAFLKTATVNADKARAKWAQEMQRFKQQQDRVRAKAAQDKLDEAAQRQQAKDKLAAEIQDIRTRKAAACRVLKDGCDRTADSEKCTDWNDNCKSFMASLTK